MREIRAQRVEPHRILFGGKEVAKVAAEVDLVTFLQGLRASGYLGPRPILEFIHASGNKLYMGIAAEGNHVAYVDASLDPPYFSSAGDPAVREGDKVVEFQMSQEGHVTEILKRETIPFDDLVRVAVAFLRSGVRPVDAIAWKED